MKKTRNRQLQVAVIGKGRLGSSLALALKEKTRSFGLHSHVSARAASFKSIGKDGGPDILIIATRDRDIRAVARKAIRFCGKDLRLIAHCAGSISPDILPQRKGVMRATFHPIQTIAKPDSKIFQDITFTISTADRAAAALLVKFAGELGAARTFALSADVLPLYHSMIVYGANFITLLGTALEEIAKEVGIGERQMKAALRPILTTALENTLSANSSKVLTGPIARGDKGTIEAHRKALGKLPKELGNLYADFLNLAKRFGLWNIKA